MMKWIKQLGLIALALLFATVCGIVSCAAPKPTPDPLAGFHVYDLQHLDDNKAITADYKAYIQTLSPEEQKFATLDYYYEDGAGQHAVLITVGLNHTDWRHVLIYDKDNKRIKTIKYISGNSMS
jgi:hypothetical protein